MKRAEKMRAAACDVLALGGAAVFVYGVHQAWAPAAYLVGGLFLFWAADVLRGRVN